MMVDKNIKNEPSMYQEPNNSTQKELYYRVELEKYFENSIGSNTEKLQNFCKYIPRQSLARFICKYELFKKILCVQGSIIECGVFLGGGLMSFAQLSAIFEPANNQRKIIGFDTFSGFVSISQEDKKGKSIFCKVGGLSADSFDDLKKSIKLYDINRFNSHINKVMLVKGDIKKTLPKYLKENPHTVVSLLYLDFDMFEPTKFVLKKLISRMPKGAIIVFDQLNSEKFVGETIAVLKIIGIKNLRIQRFSFDNFISYAVIE